MKYIFTGTLSHNRARVLHLKWAHNSSPEPLSSPFPIPQAARPHLVSAHASHARSDTSRVSSELRRNPAEMATASDGDKGVAAPPQLESFLAIGLDQRTAENALANRKVTANLTAVIAEVCATRLSSSLSLRFDLMGEKSRP